MEPDDSLAFIVIELIEVNLKEDEVNGRYIGDDPKRLARKLIDATQSRACGRHQPS